MDNIVISIFNQEGYTLTSKGLRIIRITFDLCCESFLGNDDIFQ